MKKSTLENIFAKWQRVQDLRAEIKSEYDTRKSINTTTEYSGSRHRRRAGPVQQAFERLEALRADLADAENDFYTDCEQVEAWLRTIPDLEIVSIIRWRFLLGISWAKTSEKIYSEKDESRARKTFYRYTEAHNIFEDEPE